MPTDATPGKGIDLIEKHLRGYAAEMIEDRRLVRLPDGGKPVCDGCAFQVTLSPEVVIQYADKLASLRSALAAAESRVEPGLRVLIQERDRLKERVGELEVAFLESSRDAGEAHRKLAVAVKRVEELEEDLTFARTVKPNEYEMIRSSERAAHQMKHEVEKKLAAEVALRTAAEADLDALVPAADFGAGMVGSITRDEIHAARAVLDRLAKPTS